MMNEQTNVQTDNANPRVTSQLKKTTFFPNHGKDMILPKYPEDPHYIEHRLLDTE